MLPENITLPNITYEQKISPPNDGVYNFNNRAILTSEDPLKQSQYKGQPDGQVPPATIRIMLANSESGYQPSSPGRRTLHMNPSAEYADRFKSKPTGRPHIVGFDGNTLIDSMNYQSRGVHGFFPSMKKRNLSPEEDSPTPVKTPTVSVPRTSNRKTRKAEIKTPPLILELAPQHFKVNRHIGSAHTAPPGRVTSARSDVTSRTTWSVKSRHTAPPKPVYSNLVGSSTTQSFQQLAKPKLMVGRDNPWVYRYKIKKSMNDMKKMMGNRRRQARI